MPRDLERFWRTTQNLRRFEYGPRSATLTQVADQGYAPLASPVFTGDPRAPTPATGDNDTSIATTAFVKGQGYLVGNQTITLSGDVTGSGTTAITSTLATVNANVGTFQGLTVNAKGQITGAVNQGYLITITSGQVTTALGYTPLRPSLNLSDVANTATSLNNLGGAPLASPSFTGTVTTATQLNAADGVTTIDAILKVGRGRSGVGLAYVDLHTSVGSTYDLRLIRGSGVNGNGVLLNAGTGAVGLQAGASATALLDATGTLAVSGQLQATGRQTRSGSSGATTGNQFNIAWTGSAQLWIDTINAGTFAFTSDYRIKENVTALPGMWAQVKALRPISYTRKDYEPRTPEEREWDESPMFRADPAERWGFIAHELQDTLIETAATGHKDAPNLVQSPDPFVLLAALTKALQEAMGRIEALEAAR